MDFFKAQIARIQEQLAGLSATQKMLTASLLAIMVMTLLWWSHWAAEPEMEPVLDQALSQEEIGSSRSASSTVPRNPNAFTWRPRIGCCRW